MTRLQPPRCHWPSCPASNKTMFLVGETDDAWMFAHGCGTTRALIKPSTRARSLRDKYDRDVAELRRLERLTESRREYSLPSLTPSPMEVKR